MEQQRREGHSALRATPGGGFTTFDPHPGTPVHLGEEGTEQFTVTTHVNGNRIGVQRIHDPFIRTMVKLRGFRHAWNAIFGGIKVSVWLDGSAGASRAIMTLNPLELQKETERILEARRQSREARAQGRLGPTDCCATKASNA